VSGRCGHLLCVRGITGYVLKRASSVSWENKVNPPSQRVCSVRYSVNHITVKTEPTYHLLWSMNQRSAAGLGTLPLDSLQIMESVTYLTGISAQWYHIRGYGDEGARDRAREAGRKMRGSRGGRDGAVTFKLGK